ncbi:Armadillo repeat containing protein [Pseudohyphozyma bogoriensis]|nr:Armadillo repeat containing protein [Pseudohyphozyma bogoriensis]
MDSRSKPTVVMIPLPELLPLSPTLSPAETLAVLSRIKNGIIGANQRKIALLRSGGVTSLVPLVAGDAGTAPHESLELAIQAATVLGSLSMPTAEAVLILLQSQAHKALVDALSNLSRSDLSSNLSAGGLPFRLLEALLRSIKALYCDLVRVVGPRAWGTDVIGASTGFQQDVEVKWELPSIKGKEKDSGMEVEGSTPGPVLASVDLRALADEALDLVYTSREISTESIDMDPGPSSASPEARLARTDVLAFLLEILFDCSQFSASSSDFGDTAIVPSSSRLKIADMVCSFMAGTIRSAGQREVVLGEVEEADVVMRALYRLIVFGNGKVQEAALHALTALSRDFKPIAKEHAIHDQTEINSVILELTQSPNASLRLAALTCQTISYKALRALNYFAAPSTSAEPLVPIFLNLIATEPALRANAAFTFAYLLSDNEPLQSTAVKQSTLEVLYAVLQEPPRVDQPYETAASLEEAARLREGALLVIACIAGNRSDTYKQHILSAKLLPTLVDSLSHPSAGVRAAACHCLRGVARSVNVLRTSLVEMGAARPIYNLLRDGEDLLVQIMALTVVSNLVLEFSPMRQVLLSYGCVPRLCKLARHPDTTLKINALWAIKNLSYQSSSAFKSTIANDLGWSYLGDLIGDTNPEISEQGLGILRNIVLTGDEEPITGLKEIGEDRMLSLVENSIASNVKANVLNAIYIVVNLATANEASKLAIVARDRLLRLIISHFNDDQAEIRSASVWTIINLSYRDSRSSTFSRKPVEILTKLRSLGVEHRLRGMVTDPSLDVRERVQQALEVLNGIMVTDREISSIPRWRAPDPSASASGPPKEDEKWVYPSPSSFFSALARKNRAPNPDDMPVVVPIHNAVNERVWEQVLQWEREAGAKDSEVRLVSFVGRPKDFTPRARWRNLIGYTLPFDRHDWLVDRTVPSPPSADPSTPSEPSSIRIRYVIDFYTGRALPGSAPRSAPGSDERAVEDNFRPNLAFFLDVRPALDDMMGVGMRAKRFARRWGLAGDETPTYFTAPPTSPASINNASDALLSTSACLPLLLSLLSSPSGNDISGILIACYSEHPLVTELKKHTTKPVIGIFEASVSASLMLLPSTGPTSKFGIVSTGKVWEELLDSGVKTYLGGEGRGRYGGCETTGLNATDLHDSPVDVVEGRMKDAVKRLVRRGVRAVCLGCAGMVGMEEMVRRACVEELGEEEGAKVRIVDGVKAGYLMLEGLVKAGLYPLDTIKTRIQLESSAPPHPAAIANGIHREAAPTKLNLDGVPKPGSAAGVRNLVLKLFKEQGLPGFYRGFGANMVNTFSMQFAYFYWYTIVRRTYLKRFPSLNGINTITELLLGAIAAAFAQLFTIPVSVIATRQQLSDVPISFGTTLKSILADDGVTGLWRGLKPSLVLTVNPAITYGVFERLKAAFVGEGKMTPGKAFALGAGSKTLATVVTYPYIMAKTRLQAGGLQASESEAIEGTPLSTAVTDADTATTVDGQVVLPGTVPEKKKKRKEKYSGAIDCLSQIYKDKGFAGWYQGMQAQIIKAVLAQALLFGIKDALEGYVKLAVALYLARRA